MPLGRVVSEFYQDQPLSVLITVLLEADPIDFDETSFQVRYEFHHTYLICTFTRAVFRLNHLKQPQVKQITVIREWITIATARSPSRGMAIAGVLSKAKLIKNSLPQRRSGSSTGGQDPAAPPSYGPVPSWGM